MTQSADKDPFEKLKLLFEEEKYSKCLSLYQQAEEVFTQGNGDEDRYIDELAMLVLHYHVMPKCKSSIRDVMQRRMRSFKEQYRELRIYVAGEVAVGKSTFINLLMGGEYLPTGHRRTTNVLCEIWNNPHRIGRIYYSEKLSEATELHLPENPNDGAWKRIQQCIKSKIDEINGEDRPVYKVEIFWPFSIFKESLHQTRVKSVDQSDRIREACGSISYGSELPEIVHGSLPICFMDFPGIDTRDPSISDMYLQHLDKCHSFIVILDVKRHTGVNKETIQSLMKNVLGDIANEGVDLNPESALFLCMFCPEYILQDGSELGKLKTEILDDLQESWPMVSDKQIVFFDQYQGVKDTTLKLSLYLQEDIVNFLLRAERLVIEEHCMWLTNLLESASAFLKQKKRWQINKDVISDIIKDATKLKNIFLEFHKEHLSPTSKFLVHIRNIQNNHQDILKRYLEDKLRDEREDLSLADLIKIGKANKLSEMNSKLTDCETAIKQTIQNFEDKILTTSGFGNIWKDVQRMRSLPLDINPAAKFLGLFGFLILLKPISLAFSFFAVIETIKMWRNDETLTKSKLISLIVKKIEKGVDDQLNDLSLALGNQIQYLENIIKNGCMDRIEDKLYVRNGNEMFVSERLNDISKELWDIYVGYLMTHELETSEIEKGELIYNNETTAVFKAKIRHKSECYAVKEIQTTICKRKKFEKEQYSCSVPSDSTIYRELCLLKQLSAKKTDPDFHHFVSYEGSACRIKDEHYTLQLVMRLYKSNLADRCKDSFQQRDDNKTTAFALGAARGLRFCHKNRVVHRDVKSSNFLVDEYENIVICDVGHSKECDKVQTLKDRGTRLYLAPEQLDHRYPHTMASDIYSFGLVLWELFHRKRLNRTTFREGQPPPSSDTKIDTELIKRCLDKDPQKRPSIEQIITKLENFKG